MGKRIKKSTMQNLPESVSELAELNLEDIDLFLTLSGPPGSMKEIL